MALIKCPECSTQICDKADACPSCGYPIAKNVADNPNRPNSSPQSVAVVKAAKSRGLYIILGFSSAGWAFTIFTQAFMVEERHS